MKFSPVLLACMLAIANAQSVCSPIAAAIPTCARSCIDSAAAGQGCAPTAYACQCSSSQSAQIGISAQACVLAACGLTTGLVVQVSANAVCACVTSNASPLTTSPASTSALVSSTRASTSASPASSGSSTAVAKTSSAASSDSSSGSAKVTSSTSSIVAGASTAASSTTAKAASGAALDASSWLGIEGLVVAGFAGFLAFF